MPSFGGFAINTGGLVNNLATNVVGSISNSLFPRTGFGGFDVGGSSSLIGQLKMSQDFTNRRASLRPKDAGVKRALGDGILNPLKQTNNGMIWPYTPTINYNHTVDYQSIQTVHANQDFHVFARAPAVEFTVDGEFTVQNQSEGQYAMACLHFLRTMAKMNFGENDPNAGTPPPVLLFNAYGPFVFNNVPVIVKQFSFGFPNDVDYVEVTVAGNKTVQTSAATTVDTRIYGELLPGTHLGPNETVNGPFGSGGYYPGGTRTNDTTVVGKLTTTPGKSTTTQNKWTVWLPSMFKISVSLVVQHTPDTLRNRFNLPAFVNGAPNQSDFI